MVPGKIPGHGAHHRGRSASIAVIVAAAICPCPPLLVRELTGQADVLPDLRAACAAAVGFLTAAGPDVIVVAGPDEETASRGPARRRHRAASAPAHGPPGERAGAPAPRGGTSGQRGGTSGQRGGASGPPSDTSGPRAEAGRGGRPLAPR